MTSSALAPIAIQQIKRKTVSRRNINIILAAVTSIAALGFFIPEPASAVGYYGKGYVLNVAY